METINCKIEKKFFELNVLESMGQISSFLKKYHVMPNEYLNDYVLLA